VEVFARSVAELTESTNRITFMARQIALPPRPGLGYAPLISINRAYLMKEFGLSAIARMTNLQDTFGSGNP
jgi:hypothetical protein